MFRFISRRAAVAAIALLFALVCIPAAQARSFEPAHQSFDLGTPWLDSALAWVSRLLGGEPVARPAKAKPTLNKATANSGSCIDPQGNPRPCM